MQKADFRTVKYPIRDASERTSLAPRRPRRSPQAHGIKQTSPHCHRRLLPEFPEPFAFGKVFSLTYRWSMSLGTYCPSWLMDGSQRENKIQYIHTCLAPQKNPPVHSRSHDIRKSHCLESEMRRSVETRWMVFLERRGAGS